MGFGIFWGAALWLLTVTLTSAAAAIGAVSRSGRPIEWSDALAMAWLAGAAFLLGAPIFYALRPLHRTRVGTFAAGWVAAVPVVYPAIRFHYGPRGLLPDSWTAVLFATLLGFGAGLAQWWSDRSAGA
jgi:hypothetical protein